jgi:hypothetical protein
MRLLRKLNVSPLAQQISDPAAGDPLIAAQNVARPRMLLQLWRTLPQPIRERLSPALRRLVDMSGSKSN